MQVLLHDNPLVKSGLSWAQRLQYFTTMYNYFYGFATLAFMGAPVVYLLFGIAPVTSYAGEFLWRIIPYIVVNNLMFAYITWNIKAFRGQQYTIALFPIWIRAVLTVLAGYDISFKVTPKTRQSGTFLHLVIPQLTVVAILITSGLYAAFGLAVGWRNDSIGVTINIFWAIYDIIMLSAIIRAAVYHPDNAPVE